MTLEIDRAALEGIRGLTGATREYSVTGIEIRAKDDEDSPILDFYGHASVTAKPYDMYGGPDKGGWVEIVDKGSFKKTLSEKPDVAFLVNHGGLTLARTKAKTLQLREDDIGLEVKAQLDSRVSIVNDISILMEAGNLDEMSFAFRVTKQSWFDADGEEVPWWDLAGIERHIREVSIQKGDVSVVNYGANPYTDAALRGIPDDALLAVLAERPELAARAATLLAPAAAPVVEPKVHPDLAERLYVAAQRRCGWRAA